MENDPYRTLKEYQQKGGTFLRQAIDFDEQGNKKEMAIMLYKQGVRELEKAMEIKIDQNDAKIVELRNRMGRNLEMSRDRIKTLQIHVRKDDNVSHLNSQDQPKTSKNAQQQNKEIFSNKIRKDSASSGNKIFHRPKAAPGRPNLPPKNGDSAGARAISPSKDEPRRPFKVPGVESDLVKKILDSVLTTKPNVSFDDIGGLQRAKTALQEAVILPLLRPEVFTGLRAPVKGILLFGPPGNGKTMLAKAVASEAKTNFLNVTAADLTARFLGDGERMVRALFAVARELQPSIIFIDEIDSLLTERGGNEHDAMRRLKLEFLTQFDGVQTQSEDRVLVLGATNRPFDLDDAALRRFTRRIYIPLPDGETRKQMLKHLLKNQEHELRERDFDQLVFNTENFSASDLTALAKDAAMGPVRELRIEELKKVSASRIRPINRKDFDEALRKIRPSVSRQILQKCIDWSSKFADVS